MRSKLLPVFAVGAIVLLVVNACATPAKIKQISDKEVIEVKTDEKARPIQFRKIVIDIKRGTDIGSVKTGILCIPERELIHRGGRQIVAGDDLTEVFQDELTAANYVVVGDPDALFDDPSAWKAKYLIAGKVEDMKANICYPFNKFGSIAAKGEAFMRVDWQIYSRLDRRVVYKLSTEGASEIKKKRAGGDVDLFLDAFAQATRNMLADQGFHDLITTRISDDEVRPEREILISGPPLSKMKLTEHINEIRKNVVTVFAGDGHGSGFFIDASGHILTNEHVVRTAQHVRLKLVTGREILGEVIATNVRRDVALIKAERSSARGLPLQTKAPKIGAEVYAVGSPLDESLDTTLTRGIVSAYRVEDGLEMIQSDVTILPGNSGGPLLDAQGNVVGLSVSGYSAGAAPMGVNFFIPIRDAIEKMGIRSAQ